VVRQLEPALQARIPVVSTCEEMSFPDRKSPALKEKLDRLARWYGVPVLGAGINPGFVMDKLPITLMAACREVRAVGVRRVIDASDRRGPFQKKIGHGMTTRAFAKAREEGAIGHVGLEESAGLIARAAGFEIDRFDASMEPVVGPGGKKLLGMTQSVIGYEGKREVLFLEMTMQVGGVESLDEVIIDGAPEIEVKIPGGIHGDEGTVAVVVNAIPSLLSASPGLHTVADLPFHPLFPGLAARPKPAARAPKAAARKAPKKAAKKAAKKPARKKAARKVAKAPARKKTGRKPTRKKRGSR
jgi:4-hydroxy-tetrahydrodipicolinate reductase